MVYFVTDGTGLVKIGYTRGLMADRLHGLQAGNGRPLRVLAVLNGGGPASEDVLHKRFARDRALNEWFKATPELMAVIELAKANPALDGFSALAELDNPFRRREPVKAQPTPLATALRRAAVLTAAGDGARRVGLGDQRLVKSMLQWRWLQSYKVAVPGGHVVHLRCTKLGKRRLHEYEAQIASASEE